MLVKLYTVYDQKSLAYLPPFHAATHGAAIRLFSETCTEPSSHFYKHPDDFYLAYIGDYDNENAELLGLKKPEIIAQAREFSPEATYQPVEGISVS